MRPAFPFLPTRDQVAERYGVRLVEVLRIAPEGLVGRCGDGEDALPWERVRRVLAAEVGEPQGVRTVVFDLVLESAGAGHAVRRFEAEPGEEAVARAQALMRWLPAECLCAAIKSLACDGLAGEWYPDVASFEEAAVASLVGGAA